MSQSNPTHLIVTISTPDGVVLGTMVGIRRTFSSGSVGYNVTGKVDDIASGERLQVGANLIVIGSKPVTPAKRAK